MKLHLTSNLNCFCFIESRSDTENDLAHCQELLDSSNNEVSALNKKVETLESKCTKLREYTRKLTQKCEEWEVSYDQQAQLIAKLQDRNGRNKQKASELAQKYKRLSGDVQRRSRVHQDDREKWTAERSSLRNIHTQLEEELEVIAKELSNIDVAWKEGRRSM